MEGVDNDGDTGEPRGDTADGARLGSMRVHHVRPEASHQARQRPQAPQVLQTANLAAQIWHRHQVLEDLPVQLQVVALVLALRSGHEHRLVSGRVEALAEQGGMDGRAADVEARDDAQHAGHACTPAGWRSTAARRAPLACTE